MNRVLLSLGLVLVAWVGAASPVKCLLIVRNHCTAVESLPIHAVAATLESSLAGEVFSIVNSETAVGEDSSARSPMVLAQKYDCDYILTATIQEFGGESIGSPVVANRLKVRMALALANASTGATVIGSSERLFSKNYTVEQVSEDNQVVFEDLLHLAASKSAESLLKKALARNLTAPTPAKSKVFFGCNVLGADVVIDGASYGTLPAEIAITPGIHSIEVAYPPYYHSFKRAEAKLFDGQTFAVVLQLTDEGRAMKEADESRAEEKAVKSELFKKQLALADELLGRYRESGATDDYVRKIVAEGVSIYWKNSHGQIAITDGKAENIDFATPRTTTNDPISMPDTGNALNALRELLDHKGE